MSTSVAIGAAFVLSEKLLGGVISEQESIITLNAVTPVQVCTNNPDRVGLVIQNVGSNQATIAISASQAIAFNGIQLVGSSGVVSLIVRDDFTLTTRQWWGACQSGPGTLYVLEVFRINIKPEVQQP